MDKGRRTEGGEVGRRSMGGKGRRSMGGKGRSWVYHWEWQSDSLTLDTAILLNAHISRGDFSRIARALSLP